MEENKQPVLGTGLANSNVAEQQEKSRSRSRVGVTTGQIAIGTPSYAFKSKLKLAGINNAPSGAGGSVSAAGNSLRDGG